MGWIKTLHIACAVISFCGFFLRGVWMLRQSPLLQNPFTKILPHIVDTVLLISAIALLYQLQLNVLEHNWLLAKIAALLVYIILGSLALKRGSSRCIRLFSWIAALLVFAYIVSVAISKSPLGVVV